MRNKRQKSFSLARSPLRLPGSADTRGLLPLLLLLLTEEDPLPPTPTCGPHQQQKHLLTAKHHATEGRTSPRIAPKDA